MKKNSRKLKLAIKQLINATWILRYEMPDDEINKTRKLLVKLAKNEYGVVKKGDRVVGQIEFESSRFSHGDWKVTKEERK